jgi:hypothetical protein
MAPAAAAGRRAGARAAWSGCLDPSPDAARDAEPDRARSSRSPVPFSRFRSQGTPVKAGRRRCSAVRSWMRYRSARPALTMSAWGDGYGADKVAVAIGRAQMLAPLRRSVVIRPWRTIWFAFTSKISAKSQRSAISSWNTTGFMPWLTMSRSSRKPPLIDRLRVSRVRGGIVPSCVRKERLVRKTRDT